MPQEALAPNIAPGLPKSAKVGSVNPAICRKAVPSNPCSSAETASSTNFFGSMPPRTHRACKSSGSRLLSKPPMNRILNHCGATQWMISRVTGDLK